METVDSDPEILAPELRGPTPLSSSHDVSDFRSGNDTLDLWLHTRAFNNESSGASRTYVVCAQNKVRAYYCLAAGSIELTSALGRVRRNMPDPIPVMIIGRLAVHVDFQGRGLGLDLVRDAVLRTVSAATIVGIRAIVVHAISEDAMQFYQRAGFKPSPIDPRTLMVRLTDLEATLGRPQE